jgi:hypothetical protein
MGVPPPPPPPSWLWLLLWRPGVAAAEAGPDEPAVGAAA